MLLLWGMRNFRPFPWRVQRTPYKVFISEFLLQKTDAEKVMDVYQSMLNAYPDLEALGSASEMNLRKTLRDLGLYYRSSRMIDAAKEIISRFDGEIPWDEGALLSLRGIGKYIANAILCFGFGFQVPLIDTNIARILKRHWELQSAVSRPRDDKSLWEFARALVPNKAAQQYNYALLDLGALICHAREPGCNDCPLGKTCEGRPSLSLLT